MDAQTKARSPKQLLKTALEWKNTALPVVGPGGRDLGDLLCDATDESVAGAVA